MVAMTTLPAPVELTDLCALIKTQLGRTPQLIAGSKSSIQTIAWCTGAAQQYIDIAILADVDVFISGEISEQTVHAVRESNTAYIAAGHHATERYGIQALGDHLSEKLGLLHEFVEIDNPV